MWPMSIVQQLRKTLPLGFRAEPRVHLGTFYEIESSTNNATEPSVAIDVEPDEEYEYAVHVYDTEREQTLVAAIEIVSPANKDRPEKRNSFVAKCAALLRQGVCVCVVDLVTFRHFNLYTELMAFLGQDRRPDECESARHLRCLVSVGASRREIAAGNLVAHHDGWSTAAAPAIVASRRSLHLARPGSEL
jgi:hypothetical protein